jgi:hypothetical protein
VDADGAPPHTNDQSKNPPVNVVHRIIPTFSYYVLTNDTKKRIATLSAFCRIAAPLRHHPWNAGKAMQGIPQANTAK